MSKLAVLTGSDSNKVYTGYRLDDPNDKRGITIVKVNNTPLKSILVDTGYDGLKFDWGYKGNLASNLAISILVDYYERDVPDEIWKTFKQDVIEKLPSGSWSMTDKQIATWVLAYVEKYRNGIQS